MKLMVGLIIGSSLGIGFLIGPWIPICMIVGTGALKIFNMQTSKEN